MRSNVTQSWSLDTVHEVLAVNVKGCVEPAAGTEISVVPIVRASSVVSFEHPTTANSATAAAIISLKVFISVYF